MCVCGWVGVGVSVCGVCGVVCDGLSLPAVPLSLSSSAPSVRANNLVCSRSKSGKNFIVGIVTQGRGDV